MGKLSKSPFQGFAKKRKKQENWVFVHVEQICLMNFRNRNLRNFYERQKVITFSLLRSKHNQIILCYIFFIFSTVRTKRGKRKGSSCARYGRRVERDDVRTNQHIDIISVYFRRFLYCGTKYNRMLFPTFPLPVFLVAAAKIRRREFRWSGKRCGKINLVHGQYSNRWSENWGGIIANWKLNQYLALITWNTVSIAIFGSL